MKKTIKIMAAIMLVAAMVLSIASCGGLDMSKIKGDWIMSTINGKSVADYAAESGYPEAYAQKQYNFTDKQMTVSSIGASGTVETYSGDLTVKSNGVNATVNGVDFGFLYDEKADTLTYNVTIGSDSYEYVLKKGTYDFAAALGGAPANNEASSEGGEEYSGEEYSDEEYAEEGYAE